ncbi:hypothetical protein BFS16_04450 [Hoylesella timonensis]|uniref:AAA+ ATPase domain-containing protein n=1 Tax=Hoylesella timonensis TaxID=386414 RepID=A0A2K0XM56_9BACT|nr:helix-turn-helix domain-containing protein [Hoylesella timonensis]PNP95616.1 hypothetical protein BFS16_04450 [Hoylesella timonensis]
MEENTELKLAWEFVEHTEQSIFLTGKAGTGKTTFLKMVKKHSSKRLIVVAPTGVAAINAGGVTIHSFFQLPLSPFVPNATVRERYNFGKEKRKIIRTLDMLIIDEISMVRSDLLDAIDAVLRRYRQHDRPFGGVQLLMIGDLQQLTPVVTPADEALLRPYYDTPYFFGSHALQQTPYVTIQLQKVYRQQDETFLNILNHLRENTLSPTDLQILNERYQPHFQPQQEEGYIRLTTHNNKADSYNDMRLEQLPAKAYHYMASIKGTFPKYSYPTSESLVFKVGAQVMFIKNDSSAEHLFYNGKIGHIIYLDDSHIEVLCPGDEHSIVVEKQTWENTTYKINEATKEIEPTVQGTFSQYPLRLAWAITIHKSQGLTFERAIIDAGSSFAFGQVYVALSRCKTLEGLVLASPITAEAIINDQGVADYINRQDEEARKSIEQLPRLKDDYERFQLIELFQFMDIWRAEEMLCRLLIEFFHSYSKLILIHKSTIKELQEKVNIIAYKWTTYISQLTIEQIHDPLFLERVVASANYFKKTFKHYLEDLIEQTLEVKSNNKVAMRRLDNYLTDLREMYLAKKYLLQTVITNGFTTENYLRAKQEALLMALDELSPTSQRRSKSTKKKKEKKENTKDITLQLLKSGLTPLQIATERKLTISTIYTHLGYFVKEGVIDINDFMEQEHIQNIQQVIQKIGVDNGRTAIKALCLPTVTYEEINLMIAAFHRS